MASDDFEAAAAVPRNLFLAIVRARRPLANLAFEKPSRTARFTPAASSTDAFITRGCK
jgi:hypothetical protein